jgi:hypothetical protein
LEFVARNFSAAQDFNINADKLSAEEVSTFVRVNADLGTVKLSGGAQDMRKVAEKLLAQRRTLCPSHIHTVREVDDVAEGVSHLISEVPYAPIGRVVQRIVITDRTEELETMRTALTFVKAQVVKVGDGKLKQSDLRLLPDDHQDGQVVDVVLFVALSNEESGRQLVECVEGVVRQVLSDPSSVQQFAYGMARMSFILQKPLRIPQVDIGLQLQHVVELKCNDSDNDDSEYGEEVDDDQDSEEESEMVEEEEQERNQEFSNVNNTQQDAAQDVDEMLVD